MKKIIISIMLGIIFLVPVAFAQSATEMVAGTTPDDAFYGIDKWWDNMRISFSSGLNKEKIKLDVAEERLAEYKVMIDEKKSDKAVVAEVERNKMISSVDTSLLNDDEKLEIQEQLLKHKLTLEKVRNLVPEQARKGIDNAIEQSSKVFEKVKSEIPQEKRISDDKIKENIEIKEEIIKSSAPRCVGEGCIVISPEEQDKFRQICLSEGGTIKQDYPDFECSCPASTIANSELRFGGDPLKCNIICNRGYKLENNQCVKIPDKTLCESSDGIFTSNLGNIIEKTFSDKLTSSNYENYIKNKVIGAETTFRECNDVENIIPKICSINNGYEVCKREEQRIMVVECTLKMKIPPQSQDSCICPIESIGFTEGFGCDYQNIILTKFSLFSIFG